MKHEDYPCLFQKSDTASIKQQSYYLIASKTEFTFVLLSAILGGLIICGNIKASVACLILTAIALFIAFIIRIVIQLNRWDRKWFDTRAIAESAKTATWRYVMAVDPYQVSDSDKQADKKFVNDLNEIFKMRPEAHLATASSLASVDKQITERMKEIRKLSVNDRKTIYVKQRVQAQKNWYKAKAKFNGDRDLLWFFRIIICEALGVCVAVGLIFLPGAFLNPIGVMTTLTAVFCAWVQIKKHRELSQSYALAEQELSSTESLAEHVHTETDLMEYVVNSENAISREHTMWCAKRI
jgi:hypothetical protein